MEQRRVLMDGAAAMIEVEIIRDGVVADGVGIFHELYGRKKSVGFAVENLDVAGVAIGDVNEVEVFAKEYGMRFADAFNGVDGFAGLQVENQNCFVAFRGGEEAI